MPKSRVRGGAIAGLAVGLAVLIAGGSWFVASAAEARVQDTAGKALLSENLLVDVEYDGFDAVLSGDVKHRKRAIKVVSKVPGTRNVRWDESKKTESATEQASSNSSGSTDPAASASHSASQKPSASAKSDAPSASSPTDTPTPTPTPSKPAVQIPDKIPPVHFEGGVASISTADRKRIAALASLLKQAPKARIVLIGHTDNGRTAEFRSKLSLERAQTIADVLAGDGVEASRISVKGAGKSKPLATNSTEEGRALNRRVEIRIVKG